jgi:hypothetical protein
MWLAWAQTCSTRSGVPKVPADRSIGGYRRAGPAIGQVRRTTTNELARRRVAMCSARPYRPHRLGGPSPYIALAEALDVPLLTRDRRLAAAAGHQAQIDLE